ncbi:hypothetical protein N7493_003522 [Penicillium malachiteum]|uniref:Uncharacterized protein n=1 Tax=Penicillium malachiteum TaxID=1324776 RepID=A0AAD6HQG3_9EURO|nr:hypothetical protein N7493_003522 [Penicillium malachiteum]
MASQSEQPENLDSMIQATTSFYNALWDYWGVMIHEEDNLQLKDGTFKGLDRAVRAYLNSLRKSQMKRAQDGDQSHRESDKLEAPCEEIPGIFKKAIENQVQKVQLQVDALVRSFESVDSTGDSTIEQAKALMTPPTEEEVEKAIQRREDSESNFDNSPSFTPEDYLQEANKRMDDRAWPDLIWLTPLSRPPSQDDANMDLRKIRVPRGLNTQIPNFLNQLQEKEDEESDTAGSASSMNQELNQFMRLDSSSRNSVDSSSWADEDDWGRQEIHGTQEEAQDDENLTENESSLEDDENLGLKKMYETQEDENLAENQNTEYSQASTETQHLLSDSVSRRDDMPRAFKSGWW